MEIDPSRPQEQCTKQKAEALRDLTTKGPLSSSIAKLSGSSRGIPSEKDFHFYNNFSEFKVPIKEIADASQSMLGAIGSSAHLWGEEVGFHEDFDDGHDWLVNANDEIFERFDVSVDEFQRLRKKEEETGVRVTSSMELEGGFQLVYGKKKKGASHLVEKNRAEVSSPSSAVKVASRDKKTMGTKPKVPFHIPTITKPQDEFKIMVNNANQPFEHVWLQRSEDGTRFIHPQEKFSVLDFVDTNIGDVEPVKPPPIESTPFKLVAEVKDLKELAAKLCGVNEFAIDLEHNQYRSFQGLTCLMQISTRAEDFVIDTLKLRIHVGPYLREVFKDPTKKKVMHGADRDVVWLQRDFGIYICNLFDTGQASRVLKLERNSLEYLLYQFCGVTANKEYQNADWRLRPLPDEMLRYAREDTHYLLHVYDLLRIRLLSTSTDSEKSDDLLVEVYKRSYDLCMQLYEKELLTDSSYLHIYGLLGAGLNARQLAIVAGLCQWRDIVARANDESTGYVLPNRALLEIAKQMPVTTSQLRRLVKSKHPYVERNLGSVVSIIKNAMQNAAAFEADAEYLKEKHMEMASEESMVPAASADVNEASPPEPQAGLETVTAGQSVGCSISTTNHSMSRRGLAGSVHLNESELGSNNAVMCRNDQCALEHTAQTGNIENQRDGRITNVLGGGPFITTQIRQTNTDLSASDSGARATVQVLKKPNRAFGALLGNPTTKRKLDPDKKEREETKLEQIKSSVNLPFHSFVGRVELLQPLSKEPAKALESVRREELSPVQAVGSNVEDVILLESNANNIEESGNGEATDGKSEHREDRTSGLALEMDDGDEIMSLSDLSSSFQKCLKSMDQTRKCSQAEKSKESYDGFLELKPFDYEAARKQFRFGEDLAAATESGKEGDGEGYSRRLDKVNRKQSSVVVGQSHKDEETRDFPQGRRRQAFPASGNRSATFR